MTDDYQHSMVVPLPLSRIGVTGGSVTEPSVDLGDGNGLYQPAAGTLAIATTGAERLRVDGDGRVGIGTIADSYGHLNVMVHAADYAGSVVLIDAERPADGVYNFLVARANAPSNDDWKFIFRGDGNAYADGGWYGVGADYAEFFEWSDGNPAGADRRGLSVVLDGSKIRPAMDADLPHAILGVTSAVPTIVGDAAWNGWTGKYQRDAYGTLLTEEYEIVAWEDATPTADADGTATIPRSYATDAVPEGVVVPPNARRLTRRRPVLNQDFDASRPYVPRADRPEWAMIGLMGKLRVRKGQPVGDRWVKLRAVTEEVEEWLVR